MTFCVKSSMIVSQKVVIILWLLFLLKLAMDIL